MIDRRHFVRISAGAACGGFLGLGHASLAEQTEAAGDRSLDKIGVQLYTVRTLMEKDFEGTLEAIAEIGFDQVEFFNYYGRQPRQVRQILDRLGLETPSAHFSSQALKEDPAAVIETALAMGHRPVAVIGDYDSLDPEVLRGFSEAERLHVAEQDTIDFEKCLSRIDAPFVIATGVTAGRIDHALAAYSVLVRRVGPPTLILAEEDVVFAAPARVELNVSPGTRVSLFPMSPVTGRSQGLKWPIDGLDFAPDGQIGTSNEATGPVSLDFDAPGMLVILPRAALRAALAALTC